MLVACGLAVVAMPTSAAVISPATFPSNTGQNRADGPWMIGYDFSVVGSDIIINSLGVEDTQNVGTGVVASYPYGDGTFSATQVGIWQGSTLLASVTIKASKASPIIDGFRYEKLSAPITLQVGQSYTIGAQKGGGVDFFLDDNTAGGAYVGNGINVTASRVNTGATFSKPLSTGGANLTRWSGGNATLVNSAPVETPALFNWAGTGTTLAERNDFAGTVGYQFTTGPQGHQVKSLGFFDYNQDGLATSHQVGIWDATTQALLAQVTVAAGTADPLYEFFRYHNLSTTLMLEPNKAYWIGAVVTNTGDIWYDNATTFGFNPSSDPIYSGFTIDSGRFVGGGFGAPTTANGTRYFLAPNMLVPEPSSFAMLLFGSVMFWRVRRKRG